MFTAIPHEAANVVGTIGVFIYLGAYASLQLGFLRGQSYSYAILNLVAASCILVSLVSAFNASSMLIQVSWILISMAGILRQYFLKRLTRLAPADKAFLESKFPDLPIHLARKILNLGTWLELDTDHVIARQGEVLDSLVYLADAKVSIVVDGVRVGSSLGDTYIGELTCFNGEPASATVVVSEPSQAFLIDVAKLRRATARNVEVRLAFAASFALDTRGKLVEQNRRYGELARTSGHATA